MFFNIEKLQNAFRKLKHYYYYDTTSLLIRKQIAEFESQGDLDQKF